MYTGYIQDITLAVFFPDVPAYLHQQKLLYDNDYKVVYKIGYLEYVFTGQSLLFEIADVVLRDVTSTDMIWRWTSKWVVISALAKILRVCRHSYHLSNTSTYLIIMALGNWQYTITSWTHPQLKSRDTPLIHSAHEHSQTGATFQSPSNNINQCWLTITNIQWQSHDGDFVRDKSAVN